MSANRIIQAIYVWIRKVSELIALKLKKKND